MSEKKYEIYPGTLYYYSIGLYCGVFVSNSVMRKLSSLQAKYLEEVRRCLSDNKGEVFPYMWTLHYPNGKQTHVNFVDKSRDVESAIKHACTPRQPEAVFPVFVASSMKEAQEMADARHAELSAESGASAS